MSKKIKIIYLAIASMSFVAPACKKELNVGNPNEPTVTSNVNTETGLYAYAQGSTYVQGFQNGDGWLGDSYFSLNYGYSELLADVVGADAANNEISVISVPDNVTNLTGVSDVTNGSPQIPFIRSYNTRGNTAAGNNVIYFQWLNMYGLNAGCNNVLSTVDNITFTGNASSRANTVKAWASFWKGYAYGMIGSWYYSGLITDIANVTNNNYLIKDSILARSSYYYNQAISTLNAIASTSDYNTVMGNLIPQPFLNPAAGGASHGGIPTTTQWIHTINTLLARNILVNKLNPFVNGILNSTISKSSTSAMTAADWANVLTYATNGVQNGDVVFTGFSSSANSVFSASGGSVSAMTLGTNSNSTFKITERFIQNYETGDKRLANNFDSSTTYHNPNFSTRYNLIDGGAGTSGVSILGSSTVGGYELYIGPSYEENALMLAEAKIMTNNVDAGLAYVDAVRTYQGAGIAAVSGSGLTATQAMTELTKERRVALVFRGLSWFDSRRWGWSYAIKNGGGSYGNTFLTTTGSLFTNATINYNFLDYWDVPADETVLNPASSTSAAVINPNF